MAVNLDIKLKRADKVYHEGDNLSGIIVISSNNDFKHEGITLMAEGSVNLQVSSKNVGIMEAFYNSIKPIQLMQITCDVSGPGRLPSGITEIPFEIPIRAKPNRVLYETYHGVYVNIGYGLKCDIKRSFLSKDLQKQQQFLIQYRPGSGVSPQTPFSQAIQKPITFEINPASLTSGGSETRNDSRDLQGKLSTETRDFSDLPGDCFNAEQRDIFAETRDDRISQARELLNTSLVARKSSRTRHFAKIRNTFECGVPDFFIKGHLDTVCCDIKQPFKGKLVLIKSAVPIRSIELQLVRVETCGCAEGYAREATEIQNIQIGDGDIPHHIPIPIYMVFPRLFTCPTLITTNFKIEFEINIVVIFHDDYLVTNNFPIILRRDA